VDVDSLAARLDDAVLGLRAALLPRRAEISLTAAATLGRLQRAGAARLTDLAAAEGISQPAMTALVARLVEQGLVARGSDPDDGRVVVLTLTDAGASVLARRRAERTARLRGPLAGLPDDDVRRIADALPALTRLADALRRPDPVEVSR
jgi:DNA-binding MarR family transcriptional regulator